MNDKNIEKLVTLIKEENDQLRDQIKTLENRIASMEESFMNLLNALIESTGTKTN